MALVTRTGTVTSVTKTGTNGQMRTVKVCYSPPDPCEEVVHSDVPEAYYEEFRAARLANPPAPIKVSYDNEAAGNPVTGTTI